MLSDTEKGSIAIAFVREVARCLARRGQPVAPALQAARIAPALLDDPLARVSPQAFAALWLAAAQQLDDEFFGLDARRLKVGSFAALCRIAVRCRTLDDALRSVVDGVNLVLDDTRVALSVDAGEAWLTAMDAPGRPALAEPDRRFAHETLFVLLHGLICWLVDRRIETREAAFAYPAPADRLREYAAIYSTSLRFDAPHSGLRFAALHLKSPVVQNERSAAQFLRGAPATFLLKYRSESSPSARVRRLLRATPPAAWPSFEQVAERLGISESLLRRALERDGASFLAIKDALRRDLAIGQLAGDGRAIADIADELGYAEASAFTRAFKKWTGVSPGDFREGARAASGPLAPPRPARVRRPPGR